MLEIILLYFTIVIPSSILHEYAHGAMADYLGDPTARYAGRLSLNPKVHIDTFGTLILPMLLLLTSGGTFMFAYAKPVPYNPYNLRDQKYGPALVALAGPLANLSLALIFGLGFRYLSIQTLIASSFWYNLAKFFISIVYVNVILAVFNLVPIPPLDGSKILYAFLPAKANKIRFFLNQYGQILLIIFIFFLFDLIRPIISLLVNLFLGFNYF